MTSKYYAPSQQSSVAGFFSIFFGVAIIGSAISIPYLFLIRVCPYIKLTIIVTILFGATSRRIIMTVQLPISHMLPH